MSTPRMQYAADLTDAQWQPIEPLLPAPCWRLDGPGRPPRDRRQIVNGLLYLNKTGCLALSKENPRCKFQLAITDRSNGVLLGDAECVQKALRVGGVTSATSCRPFIGGRALRQRRSGSSHR